MLRPVIAEAARRAGASDAAIIALGELAPAVPAKVVGDQPFPTVAEPRIVSRVEVELDGLADTLGTVRVLPVVVTTWALSKLTLENRLRFLHRLQDAAASRTVAWVSVEGVGVAPAIPTLGDRRASGHSTIGIAVFTASELQAEAVGRCWSRGRWIEWVAKT